MKLGVISDVHSNLPALEAVLADLQDRDVDSIVCIGDLIGVLGSPNEVVTIVREQADDVVYGNHDARVFPERDWMPVHDFEVVEYEQALDELTDDNHEWLCSLPGMVERDDGVTLAHSRPDPDAPAGVDMGDKGVHAKDYVGLGAHVEGGILLLGHTHYQHAVNLDKFDGQSGLVLNPGSVGFPWNYTDHETDGRKRTGKAEFAVVDTETQDYELCSVLYDSWPVYEYLEVHDILDDAGHGSSGSNEDRASMRTGRW